MRRRNPAFLSISGRGLIGQRASGNSAEGLHSDSARVHRPSGAGEGFVRRVTAGSACRPAADGATPAATIRCPYRGKAESAIPIPSRGKIQSAAHTPCRSKIENRKSEIGNRLPAFTLIELLVVIGIIAFLIAVMLPVIARAKEQGRQVKCVANLKQIGTAMRFYGTEYNDWFPYEKRNYVKGTRPALHGFYYGGHPGRSIRPPLNWWGYIDPAYRDTPRGRPFNPYLYAELPNWDVQPEDPLFEAVRRMDHFKCPNDTGGFWMINNGDDDTPTSGTSLYYETGSSYDLNYHHAMNWAMAAPFFSKEQRGRWLQRSNAFLRQQMLFWSGQFVMLYEDPFDSAQWLRFPRRGWHRQLDRHNFLFLDGHAANTLTRTTEGSRGRGWKTASSKGPKDPKAFWNDPEDPDYKYREIDPLPGE